MPTSFLISVKSGSISSFLTAYTFTNTALQNKNVKINMIFFYKDGANILLNTKISAAWEDLLLKNNLNAGICPAAYNKRGLKLRSPFKSTSIIEFIVNCNSADRVIQF